MQIGGYLVQDRSQLSKWIQGIQRGFAELLVASKFMAKYSSELETLKEFLAYKIEQLQAKVQDLIDEKEDLDAKHVSNSEIKEHLVAELNEMTRQYTSVNSELLVKSQRVQELEQFEQLEK